MDLKRILVAVNSPTARDAAFERALALARTSGAELYAIHAVPVNDAFAFGAPARLERMADLRQRAEDAGVRVQTVEQHGDPAEIIVLHAHTRGADLIVLGGEARRPWHLHRSPVAERVLRRTEIPTLVVASHRPERPAAFRNVLVALDLSPDSAGVLDSAIALTAGEVVEVTAMHSVRGVEADDAVQSPGRWKVPEYRAHVLEDARQTLAAAVSAVGAPLDVRVHVSTGSAARSILEHAASADADLVVVGRSRGFKLLGSTALRVLRRNDRALLVIPRPGAGRAQQQRAA